MPDIHDIIAAIRERQRGTTRYVGQVPRWDEALADRVEVLEAFVRWAREESTDLVAKKRALAVLEGARRRD